MGAVTNLLLKDVQYKIDDTMFGTWRRFMYENGQVFEEFTSHGSLLGFPVVHLTRGVCPETGRRKVARGFVAMGRTAVGFFALGQLAIGFVAVGQLALGLLLGLGQGATGLLAIGQGALGVLLGLGQFATGYVAIGQFAAGFYVLAQLGVGPYVWHSRGAAPEAVSFFRGLVSFW